MYKMNYLFYKDKDISLYITSSDLEKIEIFTS